MHYLLLVICILVSACTVPLTKTVNLPTTPALAPKPLPPVVASEQTQPLATVTPPLPPQAVPAPIDPPQTNHPLQFQTISLKGITLHLLTFDSSKYALHVADQQPGTKWTSARSATTALGGVAAINGGFFSPQGKPLGLVRSAGKSVGGWNTSSSLSSGVYQLSGGHAALKRNHSANRSSPELLQTGPFLLENSQPVNGLSTSTPAQRSLLLWDGKTHFAIAQTSSCTLAQLSSALTSLPSSFPAQFALNLDGGRSCDLYVNSTINGTPVQRGHWLKSQVRNYLVLKKK